MNPQTKVAKLNLEEVVCLIWEEVYEQRANSVIDAIHALLPMEFTSEALEQIIITGLGKLAHDRQKGARMQGSTIAFGRPHGNGWQPYMATLLTPFEDADGREKSLLDFTAADLSAYQARCITIGTGWLKRARIAEHTGKQMVKYGAETVADLPAEVLEDVAARFQEVFA
jgi:hypothetical protein